MTKFNISFNAAVALFVACLSTNDATAAHIDFITAGPFNLSSSDATVVSQSVTDAASILGGTRNVSLARNQGFGGTITANTILSPGGTGTLDRIDVINTNVSAGRLTLDYDGFDDADFAASWDAFLIDVPVLQNTVGDGEIDISITVTNSLGSVTTPVDQVIGGSRFEDPGVFVFEFNDPDFGGFDFSEVDRVTFNFQTAIIGSDFQIASIIRREISVAVPEPNSLAFLMMSTLVIARRRTRRACAQA